MTDVYIVTPMNRTTVYHTEYCKNVEEIREAVGHGKCMRTDLTEQKARQWGKRECKRCQKIRKDSSDEKPARPHRSP